MTGAMAPVDPLGYISVLYRWVPDWKNPSIVQDALTDPLRQNFSTTAIAPKFFMPPQHQCGKFPSTMPNTIPCWFAELFRKPKYSVDLFLAGWVTFLTSLISFSDDCIDIFANFHHFVKILHLFGHFVDLFGLVVPICTQQATKFSAQPSICAKCTLKFLAQLPFCAEHTLKTLEQRQICAEDVDESMYFFQSGVGTGYLIAQWVSSLDLNWLMEVMLKTDGGRLFLLSKCTVKPKFFTPSFEKFSIGNAN